MKLKNKLKIIIYLVVGGFFLKMTGFLFKKKRQNNWRNFFKEEKREIKELSEGRESWKKYFHDAGVLVKDYFIPHQGNSHKPKILRTKSLACIVVGLILLKVAVVGYLFFIYPSQGWMSEQITTELLELINKDRIKNGLSPLSSNPVLFASALSKAEDMSRQHYFAHHSPDGKKPWDFIDRKKYAYLFVGENLAINFSSARSVHNALMQSSSHKKNILNSRYQDVGLAVISGVVDGKRTNILVELFGSRQGPALAMAGRQDNLAGSTKERVVDGSGAGGMVSRKQAESGSNIPSSPRLPVKPEVVEQKTAIAKTAPQSEPGAGKAVFPEDLNKKTAPRKQGAPVGTLAMTNSEISGPNPELEYHPNTELRYYNDVKDKKIGIAAKMVKTSQYIFLGILIFMILALTVNIFIRVGIQHRPVIIQTLAVIVFIAGLLSIHIHILENIADKIAVL